ncbi:glycosyltransferase [Gordonia rhizosphera]|uniref:4,4'-diaponeurosporenoate glycosyltransferase n=1 Tax=Gordonia rhizosphera NBRC 16068 TaxID=1108045 RepID=K6VQ94_9ACTN|nr:glycosyltransferase [Gordonia rhizosphera]GAB89090.1 putative glycosyltransferase [Gordonia rhizosphera NBRC 16068]
MVEGKDPHVPRARIVIPAHNEERAISRLLAALNPNVGANPYEVIVVCNGCTDRTADIARAQPGVNVIELDRPSKFNAMQVGSASATVLPLVFIDADVEIGVDDIAHLIGPLEAGSVLASAPLRVIPLGEANWIVRSYYKVWERLPRVESGLFGRGVIALANEAIDRFVAIPEVMSDDLAISDLFSERERVIVADSTVVIHPPRTTAALLRRRVRVITGIVQAEMLGVTNATESKTSVRDLVRIARQSPSAALSVPVFAAVTVAARIRARSVIRRRDFVTWQRDETSRL